MKDGFVTCTYEENGVDVVIEGKVKNITVTNDNNYEYSFYSKLVDNYRPNKFSLEFEADEGDIQYTMTRKKKMTRYSAEVEVDNLTTGALEAARAGAGAPKNSRLHITSKELLSPVQKSFDEDYPATVIFYWEA